jgi:hypothetical protein
MRKIFPISMIIGICLINAPAYCEDLPEFIKEGVLKDIGFYTPVTILIDIGMGCAVMIRDPYELKEGVPPSETKWENTAIMDSAYSDYWKEFLVHNGYLEEAVINVEKQIKPTNKLGLYGRKVGKNKIEITLAKRVLKSIDYTNKWKIQPDNVDAWSFTFTYFLEPNLPELPRLDLVKASWNFKGKGTATLNPATGHWQTRFPVNPESREVQKYGSSLGDRDAFEYAYSNFIGSLKPLFSLANL